MASPWSFSNSKSPEVSRTLLSILADLSNAVVWMVSICHLISKSSNPCINPLAYYTKSTNYNWYNPHFHVSQFFYFLKRSIYLSFFSLSFNFTQCSAGKAKSTIGQALFSFLIITRSSRRSEIRWCVCISKSQRSLCVSFPRTDSGKTI